MMQAAEDAPGPVGARLLVVDDNALSRRTIGLAVEGLGLDGVPAKNGAEALDLLRREAFDVVLLDVVMPEMDGFAVLAEMKSDAEMRDVPVIVVSALDDETDSVVRAIELRAEDFLPKNFELVLLKARLGSSLVKKRFRWPGKGIHPPRRPAYGSGGGAGNRPVQFNPETLGVDALVERDDPLGRLPPCSAAWPRKSTTARCA